MRGHSTKLNPGNVAKWQGLHPLLTYADLDIILSRIDETRQLGFSGRIVIWQDTLRMIRHFPLAGVGAGSRIPTIDAVALQDWRASQPDSREISDADVAYLFGLLDGVGAQVPDSAWQALINPPFAPREVSLPPVALWRGMERAAEARRRGETILFALHLLAEPPAEIHPEVMRASLNALRSAGLDLEARGIAVTTALLRGL